MSIDNVKYGFYTSVNHDRVYSNSDFNTIFSAVINDGVFAHIGEKFAVTPSSGMTVRVGTGRAWFNDTWTTLDSAGYLTLTASRPNLGRIDAIVLTVDLTQRMNSIGVIEGTPSASPAKPSVDSSDPTHIFNHPLAYITVPAGATAITSANIEIAVPSTTPYVTGPMQVADMSYLFAQWQAQFEDWFGNLDDELTSRTGPFSSLAIGDYFIYSNTSYIKTSSTQARNLNTDAISTFSSSTNVTVDQAANLWNKINVIETQGLEKLAVARLIDGVAFDGSTNINHLAMCNTAASTAAKTATLSGYSLVTGSWAVVKFANTNTANLAGVTLNINNTGTRGIKYRGAALEDQIQAGLYFVIYDGLNYEIIGGGIGSSRTTYTANRALITGNDGLPDASTVTSTELGYLSGMNANVKNTLNAKAPLASPSFTGTPTVAANTTTGSNSGMLRNIYISTSTPSGTAVNGSIWIKYKS